ncbi:hypothetical protein TCAL_15706 [Tigriopus californicus]|uniref:Uncharacterized protein n=1 Tax=Tigriopus californicus TaxID=6832 RepID=A0A553P8F0_TIGCA|nr:uncharacterized protein LOC131878515 [Tigriopus californicus]TRY73947.1 hypothetical protein TCAL_15706 [Tigriopus californicus]
MRSVFALALGISVFFSTQVLAQNDLEVVATGIQDDPEIKLLVCGICQCSNPLCNLTCVQECFCEACDCVNGSRCRRECNRCSDFCRNCNCRVPECASECPKCVANCNTCECGESPICNRVCPKCFNCDICDCNLSLACNSNCLKCNTDCSTCRCSLSDCESQCRKCSCPVRPPLLDGNESQKPEDGSTISELDVGDDLYSDGPSKGADDYGSSSQYDQY